MENPITNDLHDGVVVYNEVIQLAASSGVDDSANKQVWTINNINGYSMM